MPVNWGLQQFQPKTQLNLAPAIQTYFQGQKNKRQRQLQDLKLDTLQKEQARKLKLQEIRMSTAGNPQATYQALNSGGFFDEADSFRKSMVEQQKNRMGLISQQETIERERVKDFNSGLDRIAQTYANLESDEEKAKFYEEEYRPYIYNKTRKATPQWGPGIGDGAKLEARALALRGGNITKGKAQHEWITDEGDPDYELKFVFDPNTKTYEPGINPQTGKQFRQKKESKLTGFDLWMRKNQITQEQEKNKPKPLKPMTSTETKTVNDIVGTAADLVKIKGAVDNIADLKKGPITGYFLQKNPYDADIKVLENLITSVVPGMARGIFREVGVLTDQDVARYKDLFPTVKENPRVARKVFDEIMQKVQRAYKLTLKGYSKSKMDIGEWNPDADVFEMSREMLSVPKAPGSTKDIDQMTKEELKAYLGE